MEDNLLMSLMAAARWRGDCIDERRAAELAADLRRIVGHAREAAEGNDFNAEPYQFATVLADLAGQREGRQ
ncbi:hypothetical protein [Cupriavidus sp. CP313]